MSPFNTCCKPPDNLPVFPLRRFEDIPDETRFKDEIKVQEEVPDETKRHFLRNRLILMGILALFVIFFQFKK